MAVAQEEAVGNGGGGAAVGGDGLADEVAELRSLVARQQRAIEALEGRLGLGPAAGGAAASRPPASPLDGPAAVLEPSLLTRKAQGSYSSRSDHITSW